MTRLVEFPRGAHGQLFRLFAILLVATFAHDAQGRSAPGPLRLDGDNARYFVTPQGKAVYLTGAHTWDTLQDMGADNPPAPFDFDEYVQSMADHRHNFLRLWRYEVTRFTEPGANRVLFCSPHPWVRQSDRLANDGLPRFDLEQFDEAYFQRLRERIEAAGRRGIYVSIMLFEGWALRFTSDGWAHHPFNAANNVNGIDADADHDGRGLEYFTLSDPAVTALQQAYIRKVVDTVNDLENVLYEVSNENHWDSFAWENHVVAFLREYQKTKPRQHPVGLTSNGGGGRDDTQRLFASKADWISPNALSFDYKSNPPPAAGGKVIISDTDHLWGLGGDPAWVWKSFVRGLNPIFMDPHRGSVISPGAEADRWRSIWQALGQTAEVAQSLDLARTVPAGPLSSTGYCLAHPGFNYVAYLPEAPRESGLKAWLHRSPPAIELDLAHAPGEFAVEWIEPATGRKEMSDPIAGGARRTFTPPFSGEAVLVLRKRGDSRANLSRNEIAPPRQDG